MVSSGVKAVGGGHGLCKNNTIFVSIGQIDRANEKDVILTEFAARKKKAKEKQTKRRKQEMTKKR